MRPATAPGGVSATWSSTPWTASVPPTAQPTVDNTGSGAVTGYCLVRHIGAHAEPAWLTLMPPIVRGLPVVSAMQRASSRPGPTATRPGAAATPLPIHNGHKVINLLDHGTRARAQIRRPWRHRLARRRPRRGQ